MQIVRRCALFVILLLTFAAAAQNSGPASNGDFQFALEGATGAIEYNARLQGANASGEMTFTGTMSISNEDVDGEGTTVTPVSNVEVTVTFDCLRIVGNRAAMSGVVSSSTIPQYLGVRAVLAVEDNGEGSKAPDRDKFTWGVYRHTSPNWTPSDAEVPGDNGASLTWYVTDAERTDDVGHPSSQNQSGPVDCNSFPFGSYAFESLPLGAGNIQVKP
ncbi:MAG TPA: hypothetical protein VFV49_15170 [Thermoanaerobaculia bacterium]|nr:hypothetical protein [Thermoanaerobaculia bacterium]